MTKIKQFLRDNRFAIILTMLFFFINFLFLTRFPFVHSDESWLAGLSRNIMEAGNFSVTETFFDLYERNPHAIKMLFHSLQIIFIKIMGYNIFTVRFISLIFGTLTIFVFYLLNRLVFGSRPLALTASALLALDIQIIYASHFARQEIILLFILTASLYYFFLNLRTHTFKADILLGVILGLGIGFHPNSFIIFLPFVLIYLYHILKTKNLRIGNLLALCLTVALFAALFVGISLSFDPNFFTNYAKYGEQFGVTDPLRSKLEEVKYFYLKLYYGVSGTYYTPEIRLQFYLFSLLLLLSMLKVVIKRGKDMDTAISALAAIIAVNLCIVVVGRYNQTSIIFMFPLFYMLFVYLVKDLKRPAIIAVSSILIVLTVFNSVQNIRPWLNQSYRNYMSDISMAVKPSDTVLANLNAGFYFDSDKLFDYRNLALLKENGMDFAGYISRNKIKYIIYSEEMDVIYNSRPAYNGLYGNPSLYYGDMQVFINKNCQLVYEFHDGVYGMRIMQYTNTRPWSVKIYKVNE
ncbi:MAG: ArnT family glycosyltransferase [Clostridiaceae bacterium]